MKKPLFTCAMLLMMAGLVGPSWAGSIGAELTRIKTGDLKVAGATIKAQTWTVGQRSLELALQLQGASVQTTVDVLALGIPAQEYEDFKQLAAMNKTAGEDPHATAAVAGKPLGPPTRSKGPTVRARWQLGEGTAGDVTVTLRWELPSAGADDAPAGGARKAEFCIDAATQKALKKADGFLRVDLVLSADMAREPTLRIQREDQPISLCATNVQRRGPGLFEVRGRENLKDKDGVLAILFGKRT